MTHFLTPGQVTLGELEKLYRHQARVELASEARLAIDRAASVIADAASGGEAIYGVNTGFGKLANVRIAPEDTAQLQRNLILSHCAGVGAPIPPAITRLIMVMKLMSLGRGASGVRWELIELLTQMINAGILPIIPSQGSVGASGDLAPLAHMTAALMGEGEVLYKGVRMSAREALAKENLSPAQLQAKEGLAFINGTQVSTAFALAGFFDAWQLAKVALTTSALSVDAAMASSAPFTEDIHSLRGHAGQIMAARRLRELLDGSGILSSHQEEDERVQDPYCLRCQPQVTGAALDLLRQVGRTLCVEANAVTDNPLVLSDGQIVSGGNFHAEPVAFAADQIALAIAEIGAIAQRRIALLVDPALSYGLPAFLSPEPGLNSGLMIAEVTSAALMSENKALANPRSVDSTPTSANQEDHVSMACHGARRTLDMAQNLAGILAVEAMAGAQGIELRRPLQTSPVLQSVVAHIRETCPRLQDDRIVATDIERLTTLVQTSESLCEPAGTAPINFELT